MRNLLSLVLAFGVGAAVAWVAKDVSPGARRATPPPYDFTDEMKVARMPGGAPDAPAPNGGKFIPFTVTFDGDRQTHTQQVPDGPRWVFFLAGGRVVIHAVRVAD